MTNKAHHTQKHLTGDAVTVKQLLGDLTATVLGAAIQDGSLRYFLDMNSPNGMNRREWMPAYKVEARITDLFGA